MCLADWLDRRSIDASDRLRPSDLRRPLMAGRQACPADRGAACPQRYEIRSRPGHGGACPDEPTGRGVRNGRR
jgi:hypothetical protein